MKQELPVLFAKPTEVCGGGRRHLHRDAISALSLTLCCAGLAPPLAAQSNITTYYVNDGRSNAHESAAAELQLDLGGFIPFSRYAENQPGQHAYAVPYDAGSWPPGFPTTFHALMKAYGLDLYELDAKLDATITSPTSGPSTVLPFGARVEVDPEFLAYNALPVPDLLFPLELDAWWSVTSSGAPGATGKRKILMWPYRINGGAMMICMASKGNRDIARREPAEDSSILLVNYGFHWRHLGTNRNRWRDVGGEWPRQFSGPANGAFMTQDGGRFSDGTEILGLQAQAIEDGDVVVYVGENIANNLWISLQRTQEAEAYVRGEWSLAPPRPAGTYAPVPIARTHLDGRSWHLGPGRATRIGASSTSSTPPCRRWSGPASASSRSRATRAFRPRTPGRGSAHRSSAPRSMTWTTTAPKRSGARINFTCTFSSRTRPAARGEWRRDRLTSAVSPGSTTTCFRSRTSSGRP